MGSLFEDAVAGLAAIILDEDSSTKAASKQHRVAVADDDLETALASLLEESLFLLDSRGELPVRAEVRVEQGEVWRVDATLHLLERVSAPAAIKAVTYHELAVLHVADSWQATIYFDV